MEIYRELLLGAFGTGSEDLHELVQRLAESAVASMGLERESTEEEFEVVVAQIRLSYITTCVQA